jgi:hypothetical protein
MKKIMPVLSDRAGLDRLRLGSPRSAARNDQYRRAFLQRVA